MTQDFQDQTPFSQIGQQPADTADTPAPHRPESGPADTATRDLRTQRWIAAQRKAAGAGALTASALLPALAAAQAGAELVLVSSIQGVASSQVLANGALQLTLANGSLLTVAAESVTVLASGQIAVTAAAASSIASAVAAAGLGALPVIGGVAGGVGVVSAVVNQDDDPPAEVVPPLPQLTLDPDADDDGDQVIPLTDSLTKIPAPEDTVSVRVSIGDDFEGTTEQVEGSAWQFDFRPNTDLPQGDQPIIITFLDAEGEEIADQTVTFAIDTIRPTISGIETSFGPSLNSAEATQPATISGSTDAEDGQVVSVTLDGKTYTGTVAAGAFSVTIPAADLAALAEEGIGLSVDVTDAAGNPARTAFLKGFVVDFTAPTLAFDTIAGGELNKVDTQADLVITGTSNAENGQTVTVTFNGKTYTGTVTDGAWQATVPVADLSGLPENTASVSYSATVADAAGNVTSLTAATLPANLFGPAILIDPLAIGTVLNSAEATEDLTVAGSTSNVQAGQVVTVSLNGKDYTAPVQDTGRWTLDIAAADLAALTDGAALTLTAAVSDADAIPATPASAGFGVDFTAPGLAISGDNTGGAINAAEVAGGFTLTGSTDAEVGQTVTLSIGGNAVGTGLVVAGGGDALTRVAFPNSWTVAVPGDALTGLTDGTITLDVAVTDINGNPRTAQTTIALDRIAPDLAVDTIAGGDLNKADTQADLVITGTSTAEGGQTVTVTFNGKTYTGTVAEGAWQVTVPVADLSELPENTTSVSYSASVADAAGNSTTLPAVSLPANLFGPSITLDALAVGDVINITEAGAALTVSGSTGNVQANQIVTVTLAGKDYTTSVQANGTWTLNIPAADVAALTDGATLSLQAAVSDADGLAATPASRTLTTDYTAPSLTLDNTGLGKGGLNIAVQDAGLTVSGATDAENGQIVTVTLNGLTATGAANNGAWSATFTPVQLDNLGALDGVEGTLRANVADAAGNPAPEASTTITIDTVAPIVTHVDGPEAVINSAERATGITITGSASAPDGAPVTVTITDAAGTTVGTASGSALAGTYAITLSPAVLGGLPDGQNLTLTVAANDAAGNIGSDTATIRTDFTAPAVTIDTLPAFLNAAAATSALTITGTAEAGASVVVTVDGSAQAPVTATGGIWSVTYPAASVQDLADGDTIAVTAVATDAAGNASAAANASFVVDITPPTLTLDDGGEPQVLAIEDITGTDPITISGTTDLPNGASVTLDIVDGTGAVLLSTSASVTGGLFSGSFAPDDVAGAVEDGAAYTLRASASDAAGNPASDSFGFTTDLTAPVVTIDAVASAAFAAALAGEADLVITGTADEPGATVAVDLDGTTYMSGPVTAGKWTVTIPTAAAQALPGGETLSLTAATEDAAGNPGSTTADLPGLLTLAADVSGALNVEDPAAGVQVTLQAFGIATGTEVAFTVNGTPAGTTTVQASSWSPSLPASAFAGIDAGDAVTIAATAGTASASADLTAFAPPDYFLVEQSRSGNEVTMAIYLSDDTDTSGGVAADFSLSYDPAQAVYKTNSLIGAPGAFALANDTAAATGDVAVAIIIANDPGTAAPVGTFVMTLSDPAADFAITLTGATGGDTQVVIGSTGNDTLADASTVVTLLQGGAGDDSIDLTDVAPALVVIEADPASNGSDTILGFTTGAVSANADNIVFRGVDQAALRGTGEDAQDLATGGVIGANTGVVNLTTALDDLAPATLEAAVLTLTGLQAGDQFLLVATDGTDTALSLVMTDGSTASVDVYATLQGIGPVAGFDDNIIVIDPTGTVVG